MRSLLRTSDPIVRSVAALCAAGFVVGLSFGAIAAAAHIPLVKIVAMSVFIYAGGAQFLAVGIVSAGGGALAIILAGLLINARHLPFGLAIGDVIGDRRSTRTVGSHLMTDESVAFALAESEPSARRRAYWITGIGLFCTWNVACVIGALVGGAIGDPARSASTRRSRPASWPWSCPRSARSRRCGWPSAPPWSPWSRRRSCRPGCPCSSRCSGWCSRSRCRTAPR